MELKRIEKLTYDWHSASWKVIEFENPGLEKIRKLSKEAYEFIKKYSTEQFVPKEITGLLLEMQDFAWWVSDLDETPLHYLYQEIVSLVFELKKYFLTRDANTEMIEEIINERLI